MLNQLSWTTYFEIVIFLTALYYIFVLFTYYREDARQLLQSQKPTSETHQVPEALRYEQPEKVEKFEQIEYPADENPQDDILDKLQNEDFATAEKFIEQVKVCIKNASGKPYAPAILIPQIKKLFRENPDLLNSPQRPSINELIVQECESTGTALLTEDEVDQWWTD